jgi:hypothetical protein
MSTSQLNPIAFTAGLDYTLSQKHTPEKKIETLFFFSSFHCALTAHQHLVSELHPWQKKKNFFFYFRTWLRIAQSSRLLTIPCAINTGRATDLSVRVWYLEALRGFPQFDGVANTFF